MPVIYDVWWNTSISHYWSKNYNVIQGPSQTMAIPNKEPLPLVLQENPLKTHARENIKFSFSFFKRLLKALRENEETIKIEVFSPLPRPPAFFDSALRGYIPLFDPKDISTFKNEFNNWIYKNTWQNSNTSIQKEQLPPIVRHEWESYRIKLVKYHTSSTLELEVYVPHVLNALYLKMTNIWVNCVDVIYEKIRSNPDEWVKIISEKNKEKISLFDLTGNINSLSDESTSFIPVDIRLRLMPFFGSHKTITKIRNPEMFIDRLRGIYTTKYTQSSFTNLLIYNDYLHSIDTAVEGLERAWLANYQISIPKKYVDNHVFSNCACCKKLTDTDSLLWIAKTHTKYIDFKSPENTAKRIEERQQEFLKSVKNTSNKNTALYTLPSKINKDNSSYFNMAVSFLNAHIASFNKPLSNQSNEIDEYGINHKELDEAIMPYKEIQKLNSGWADTDNRKRYLFICKGCYNKINKNNTSNTLISSINLSRNPLSRNRDSIILRHGTSPLKVLGERYMLAKDENRQIEYTRHFNVKTNTLEKVAKDITLYMGVELEVCPEDDLYENHMIKRCKWDFQKYNHTSLYHDVTWVAANVVQSFLKTKPLGIITFDRSTGNGFEIVTLPGTHKWHTEEAWNGFFKEDYDDPEQAELSPTAFLSGWVNNGQPTKNKYINAALNEQGRPILNRPCCGIHIHFSRDAISPLQLGKIKYFINTHLNFIEHIAGRTSQQYARYIPSKVKDGTQMIKNQGNFASTPPGDASRYVALNLNTGKPTFEIRVFRSNVSKAGFMKNIDFVDALVNWCGVGASASEEHLTVENFINWVNERRGQYKWLTKWLITNKYISSIHKFNPKYSKEYNFVDFHIENKQTARG